MKWKSTDEQWTFSKVKDITTRNSIIIKGRDPRSDGLRAAAIIAVVCIHANLPYASVLRFSVPTFIALWAFYYERGLQRSANTWHYAITRFYKLAIPYMFWTAGYILLLSRSAEFENTPLHTIVGGLFGGYGWEGQYYFIILFQLIFIIPFIRRLVDKNAIIYTIIAGFVLNTVSEYLLFSNTIISHLGDRVFIYWIPYAFLGIALARGLPTSRRWLIGLALLAVAPFEMAQLTKLNGNASPYLLLSISLGTSALLLSFGPGESRSEKYEVHNMARIITECAHYVGRNSLAIFVCNPFMLVIIDKILNVENIEVVIYARQLLMVTFAIFGSLAIGWTLRRLGLQIVVGG